MEGGIFYHWGREVQKRESVSDNVMIFRFLTVLSITVTSKNYFKSKGALPNRKHYIHIDENCSGQKMFS